MELKSSTSAYLSLSIKGYQYPTIKNDTYDSNWLIVQVDVQHATGRWTSQSPCLLTREIAQLIDWFEQCRLQSFTQANLSFVEPELEFEIIASVSPIIRVYLEGDFKPRWAVDSHYPMEPLWLDFPSPELNYQSIVESLHQYLSQYPPRHIR